MATYKGIEINTRPTEAMAAEATKGLEWRKDNSGGTDVGVARARDIKNRVNLSLDTVKRMHSFFARHEKNKHGPNGKVAWALWGGDAGKRWADSIVAQHTEKSMEKAMNAHQKQVAREVHGDEVSSSVPGHSE